MTKKHNSELNEDLLKEALHQEMESIEPPPAEKIWQRIEAGLEQEKNPASSKLNFTRKRSFNWLRYSAVAAAAFMVVFVLNSLGVWQWDQLSFPVVSDEQMDPAEEPAVMDVEEDEAAPEAMLEEAEAPERVLHYHREEDPAPPRWPEELPGNFILDDAILLTAGDVPDYHGAVYRRADESLLLVKSGESDKTIEEFKVRLGQHLETGIHAVGEINGYTHFEAEGQTGLAWQVGGRYYALLFKAGTISPEKLIKIAEGLV